MVCVSIPRNENTSLSDGFTFISKAPSKSVNTPLVDFSTKILTPGKGSPVSFSITFPFTDFSCAKSANGKKNKKKSNVKLLHFFLIFFNYLTTDTHYGIHVYSPLSAHSVYYFRNRYKESLIIQRINRKTEYMSKTPKYICRQA